ncbi:hypothetical protein U27_01802 [Candidatus Vecturithrix granuli]|uniref:Uncharacterized protein n=1 Tax=Vecturithrix granuli TaxID=1499967 RepID=A0A0S6W966_VECG1|nr:hypothetical protein U27_01802 [Candidatus Vecturithrix granuli]
MIWRLSGLMELYGFHIIRKKISLLMRNPCSFKGVAMSFGSPGTMNIRCTAKLQFRGCQRIRETGVSRYIFKGGDEQGRIWRCGECECSNHIA